MIYYFYGKEKFLNQRKVQEYIEKYQKKYPNSLGLYIFNQENFLQDEMEGAVKTLSMFGENKLIVLNDIQDFLKENLDKIASLISSENLKESKNIFLIFTSSLDRGKYQKNDEQSSEIFKILNNLPQSSNFSQSLKNSTDLAFGKTREFVEEEAKKMGLNLDSRLISLLLKSSGDILSVINNLEKLSSFQTKKGAPITENDFFDLIDIVEKLDENAIFKSINAIASGNSAQALNIFYLLTQKDSKAIFNIWGMLGYFVRNLIIVRGLLGEGNREEEIIKKSGLKLFVVQKYIEFARNLKMDQILNLHTFLTEADIKIKTGQIDGQTALEIFVAKFSSVATFPKARK